MTTARTPGPWEVEYKKHVIGPWQKITVGEGGSQRHTVCTCENMNMTHIENEANALAISLVPEMIDFIQQVSGYADGQLREDARAILARLEAEK